MKASKSVKPSTKTTEKIDFTAAEVKAIAAFLKTHTRGATKSKFGISIGRITTIRKQFKITSKGSDKQNPLL